MVKHLLLATLLLALGCGKDVSIPNHLQKMSSVTQADSEKAVKEAVIIRGATDEIQVDEKLYAISKYSSHLARTTIEKMPMGHTKVRFQGEIKPTEVVIERFE